MTGRHQQAKRLSNKDGRGVLKGKGKREKAPQGQKSIQRFNESTIKQLNISTIKRGEVELRPLMLCLKNLFAAGCHIDRCIAGVNDQIGVFDHEIPIIAGMIG